VARIFDGWIVGGITASARRLQSGTRELPRVLVCARQIFFCARQRHAALLEERLNWRPLVEVHRRRGARHRHKANR
jgi:hypothetical protein